MMANKGFAEETHTIRIGLIQTRAFIAGIRGTTTGIADGISVVIDSNGQLGTVSSSRRYKEDIDDMGLASERLLQLRPVTFRYKEPYENNEKRLQYGLIAEEVAEVLPELVVYDEDNQPETVKYRLLSTLLLNELQNQDQTLKDQGRQLESLKTQVEELHKLVGEVAQLH
jgi:hypothetical protein